MKAFNTFAGLFFILFGPSASVAQHFTDRPLILLTKKTAESAIYDQYQNLSEDIYKALWSGKIKAYKDSMFKEPFQLEELKTYTTTIESRQKINPLNPYDLYDIIDTVVYFPFYPNQITSIETKGSVVFYRFYTDSDKEFFLRRQDVLTILPPIEQWLFRLADSIVLTGKSVRLIGIETFSQIERTLYNSIGSEKVIKYQTDSLTATISNEKASKVGSITEYTSRWKDTSNAETKRTMRLIDSIQAIHGTQVSIPVDTALVIVETIIHPLNPERGMDGIRLSLESSSESFSYTYSIVAMAPTYQPIAGGIELVRGCPIFWLKTEDALALLSKDEKLVLETISALGLKIALDPAFDSIYDEEEW